MSPSKFKEPLAFSLSFLLPDPFLLKYCFYIKINHQTPIPTLVKNHKTGIFVPSKRKRKGYYSHVHFYAILFD